MRLEAHRVAGVLLVAVLALNMGDFWVTSVMVGAGIFREANPLMAPLVGTLWFPAVKLGLVPLLLWLIWRYRDRVQRQFGRCYVFLIAFLAGVYTLPFISVSIGLLLVRT